MLEEKLGPFALLFVLNAKRKSSKVVVWEELQGKSDVLKGREQ